jgi:membrane protease YdiL (CAAX protease family)
MVMIMAWASIKGVEQPARPRLRVRGLLGRMRVTHAGIAYLAAITGAELVTALFDPILGILCHAIILGSLLIHSALAGTTEGRNFLLSMAIAPVIRIVSLGMPLGMFRQEWWYLLTSIPLFATAFVIIRTVPLHRRQIAIQLPALRALPVTIIVMASGALLGLMEFLILRPEPLTGSLAVTAIALPAAILMICTGVIEELIFRGILQTTGTKVFGTRRGIAYVSLLFGALHIGHLSVVDVIFVTAVALYFAVIVHRTRSLLGVSIAHGITNIMLFVVLPLLMR